MRPRPAGSRRTGHFLMPVSSSPPQLVSFPCAGAQLRGYLYLPEGEGPFAAMVFNHGSERDQDPRATLAGFYVERGLAFFAPHRRGHGDSPGEYAIGSMREELIARGAQGSSREQLIARVIALHEEALRDTRAALRWLELHPAVNANRIFMSGASHGAVQALLAAEADLGARAYVAFAPAAAGWPGNPELHERLLRAVRGASRPIMLAQARNDFSLGPSEVLGTELNHKGAGSLARLYPAYGPTPEHGHAAFACEAVGVWGGDVAAFLTDAS